MKHKNKLKKISIILIIGIIFSVFPVYQFTAAESGKYNILNVTFIQKCIAQLVVPTEQEVDEFDFNKNGVLDITDATHIQYIIAELKTPDPEPTSTTTGDNTTNPSDAVQTTASVPEATTNPTPSTVIDTTTAPAQPTTTIPASTVPVTEPAQPTTIPGPEYLHFDEGEIIIVTGDTYELNVVCDKDKSFLKFTSSNTSVATVSDNGIVKAISTGLITVEVKADNGLYDICEITIIDAPKSVSLDKSNQSCKVGETFIITANTNVSYYPYEYVWESSNPNIATVSRNGDNNAVIKAMCVGSTEITVETFNGKKAVCKVTVSGTTAKCIDVSVWQGDINFNKVKADGIDYVILRAGFGRENYQKDNRFEEYYSQAKAAGLKIGVYWFSYALTPEEGVDEAKACLYCLGNKKLDMPVYYDMEYPPALFELSKAENTAMAVYFCEAVKAGGYDVGVYSSASAYTYNLDLATLKSKGYSIWNAQWSSVCEIECDIWQYKSDGKVNGISTDVDCNYIYNLNIVK